MLPEARRWPHARGSGELVVVRVRRSDDDRVLCGGGNRDRPPLPAWRPKAPLCAGRFETDGLLARNPSTNDVVEEPYRAYVVPEQRARPWQPYVDVITERHIDQVRSDPESRPQVAFELKTLSYGQRVYGRVAVSLQLHEEISEDEMEALVASVGAELLYGVPAGPSVTGIFDMAALTDIAKQDVVQTIDAPRRPSRRWR